MNTKIDPKGKVALVTGANRGIGKAIVESLFNAGVAKLYAAVRNPDSASELVAGYGDKLVVLTVDMAKPETIKAAAEAAGDVEIVINNAGILLVADPLSPNVFEEFEKELAVNVYGFLHVAQNFAPILKANGGGALVQLNSIASLRNFADFSSYCASKAASYSFTQGVRDKLKEQGTAVLSVHPGPIKTDMADNAGIGDIAEPVTFVSEGIVESLKAGEPHLFPDTMAKQFWEAYQPFARNVVEQPIGEG